MPQRFSLEMMEGSEAKTELVSPPQAHLVWGDNSPLLGTNSSFEEDFFGRTPPRETSPENHSEPKQIADGFLSEVSTPDHGPIHKRQKPSPGKQNEDAEEPHCVSLENGFTREEGEERNSFDISLPKPPADNSKSDGMAREGYKDEENVIFFSHSKGEEDFNDPRTSIKLLQSANVVKEEPRTINRNNWISDAHFTNDTPSRTEVEQNTATSLKRKYFLATEEKLQRKRLKTNLSERSRTKGTAQWAHLSEEELKKLRRVKNRESVERCRTKQRLRMEALQVEQTCLRLENKNLREAATSIRDALQEISVEMAKVRDHMESHDKEDSGEKELRREIHA